MIQRLLPALLLATLGGAALAKLPAPPQDDAAKAKAAEAAAKTAWQAKVDAFQLCKSQDKVAARYGNKTGAAKTAASAASKPASAPAGAASSAAKAASAPAAAASGATPTPVSASVPPPCADPGPFAYNQPQQTPLETSGAHSPAGTATKPPSVNATSGEMTSGKK